MGLALKGALLLSSAFGIKSAFFGGGGSDDSLLDDLTPILAIGVTGFALYVIAKNR